MEKEELEVFKGEHELPISPDPSLRDSAQGQAGWLWEGEATQSNLMVMFR